MDKKVIVAGHICIDITPEIQGGRIQDPAAFLSPGRLVNVGKADIHTGGVVANTGLAMKILGADVRLLGKIGDDSFGSMIEGILGSYDAAEGLIKRNGESSSYTIVLAIPGVDRMFLHNPGANDTFCSEDIPAEALEDTALFHFGYPPLMKRIYEDNGDELVKIMRLARDSGAATSLDLAAVDPSSEAGRADWSLILSRILPLTDIFVPSIEELCSMLDGDMYARIRQRAGNRDFTEVLRQEEIVSLAEKCISMGAGIVLLKCGIPGMYYLSAGEERIGRISPRLELDVREWSDRRGFEESFVPDRVLSGTGAGDTSAAAFLVSLLAGYPPSKCAEYAAATGACCVTAYDALSGLMTLPEIDKKISAGWKKIRNGSDIG
ncbi:MAG TPA: carbohydrate kinase family protein [Lachnospiraceae bacterium]|nr:carbohydrate kinase family protein [Lachnospiraceae bacterium]